MAKQRLTTEEKAKDVIDVRKNDKAPAGTKSRAKTVRSVAQPPPTLDSGLIASCLTLVSRVMPTSLFERRGREEGHDVEAWLEAERLVKEELLQQSESVA